MRGLAGCSDDGEGGDGTNVTQADMIEDDVEAKRALGCDFVDAGAAVGMFDVARDDAAA